MAAFRKGGGGTGAESDRSWEVSEVKVNLRPKFLFFWKYRSGPVRYNIIGLLTESVGIIQLVIVCSNKGPS